LGGGDRKGLRGRREMTFLILAMPGLAFLAAGCMYAQGVSSQIGLLSPTTRSNATIVKRAVEGVDCPDGPGQYGDYGKAVRHALAQAPGANALVNAAFSSRESFQFIGATICVRVTGDAAVIR
jgi:hypothetical protein